MNHKDQPANQVSGSPAQPIAGNPSDVNKRAENPNPRANENLADQDNRKDQEHEIGTEITDGEDG
jgi:hypothetical protein